MLAGSFIGMIIILAFLALLVGGFVLQAQKEQNTMENKHNAKYAFYYLLSLVALIFTALSVGMVVFSIIDKTIADAVRSYYGGDGSLKFAISSLFIAAPIYYVISVLIGRGLKSGELEKESPLRRWLTYFILLVSSLIILGVFIGVINNFLSGELTIRFILKALTVLVISGTVFSYYLYDAKRMTAGSTDRVVAVFGWASAALVLAAFVAAWFFVESPQIARARRLDQNLISNMNSIESAVNDYYNRTGSLPAQLSDLDSRNIRLDDSLLVDPETKEAISYNRIGEDEFELCATFRLDSETYDRAYSPAYYPSGAKRHDAGYQCVPGEVYANNTVDAKPVNF